MDSRTSQEFESGASGDRLADALDACLLRLAASEPLDRVLADFPAEEAALRPLLSQATALRAERVEPEPAPTRLAMGRSRFLEAATRERTAGAASTGC